MCENLKNGKKKGVNNNLIEIEFDLCVWHKINMENMEEIQKLLFIILKITKSLSFFKR